MTKKIKKLVLFVDAQVDRDYIKERIEKLVPEYMIPGKVNIFGKYAY